MNIGILCGVWDLFHVGHLRAIKKARKLCDFLIVGVNSDKLCREYKGRLPVIPQKQRKEIIEALKEVDQTVIVNSMDRRFLFHWHKVCTVFAGESWKNSERYQKYQKQMPDIKFVFLPETEGVNSSIIINSIRYGKNGI